MLEALREKMRLKGNLDNDTQVSITYNTNHIEASKFTEEQTRYIYETNSILFEERTIINVDDIVQTVNHFKLFDYMLDIADKTLKEEIIKKFQKILKEGTFDSRKDCFNVREHKKLANEVGSMKTTLPKNLERNLIKLMEWYNSLDKITIKEIIKFHARFEKIHPFQDDNGRTGRI